MKKSRRGPLSASTKSHGAMRAKSASNRVLSPSFVTKSKAPAASNGYKILNRTPTGRKQPRLCYSISSKHKPVGATKGSWECEDNHLTNIRSNQSDKSRLEVGCRSLNNNRLAFETEAITNGRKVIPLNDQERGFSSHNTPPEKLSTMPSHGQNSPISDALASDGKSQSLSSPSSLDSDFLIPSISGQMKEELPNGLISPKEKQSSFVLRGAKSTRLLDSEKDKHGQSSSESRVRSFSVDSEFPSNFIPFARSGSHQLNESVTYEMATRETCGVDEIMAKIGELKEQRKGQAQDRLMESIEFDICDICMKERHMKQKIEQLRNENQLLKRRMDLIRCYIEDEKKKSHDTIETLYFDLCRTKKQVSSERSENLVLKSRIHDTQLMLENLTYVNDRMSAKLLTGNECTKCRSDKTAMRKEQPLGSSSPKNDRCEVTVATLGKENVSNLLMNKLNRFLCELEEKYPKLNFHESSSTLREIFQILDSIPSHDRDGKENSSSTRPRLPRRENGILQPVIGNHPSTSCLSLTEENLSEHEKHYQLMDRNSKNVDENEACDSLSDSCSDSECTVIKGRKTASITCNYDSCSVTSRLTSSTLSSLKSVEDRRFRKGLAELDAHIHRLQKKFCDNPDSHISM